MKLVKLIANLGYGSRKQVKAMFDEGRITDTSGRVLDVDDELDPTQIRIDDEGLDPLPGALLMLHKPVGYTCSTEDRGELIYDLLPPRFRHRSPVIASIGRLDRDTSGLLLMTDDGVLLHRITHPKSHLKKIYEVTLARDLRGEEADIFASGKFMLESERTPLAPAVLEVLGPRHGRLTLTEGRYHQVRRMFAAVGNHVEALYRAQIGGLTMEGLELGKWRLLDASQRERLFRG